MDCTHTHGLYSDGSAPESVFCHLLQHLQENDRNIMGLLSCESSELFLRYFRDSLNELVRSQLAGLNRAPNPRVPQGFSSTTYPAALWRWCCGGAEGRMKHPPEELDRYFRAVIEPVL